MKTWIQTGLVVLTMAVSTASLAAHESYGLPIPNPGSDSSPAGGDQVAHDLYCSVPHSGSGMVAGVGYRAICTTAALPPESYVTGCSLYRKVVAPMAPPATEIKLQQVFQDAQSAQYKGAGVAATLDKGDFTLQVSFANNVKMTCLLQPPPSPVQDQQ